MCSSVPCIGSFLVTDLNLVLLESVSYRISESKAPKFTPVRYPGGVLGVGIESRDNTLKTIAEYNELGKPNVVEEVSLSLFHLLA